MLLYLANELVRLFLRHLAAAYHILDEIPRAFDDESTQTGSSVDDIFHRCSHLAPGFEADLMRLCRHLGDSVLDVSASVTGAPLGRNRRSTIGRRCCRGR